MPPITPKQRGGIFALAKRIGLDMAELHELVEYLFSRDEGSIARLTTAEAARLFDALAGYEAICTLIDLRPGWHQARRVALLAPTCTVSSMHNTHVGG